MKGLFIACLLTIFCFKIESQSFSVSQLLALQKQNFDDKENTILSKGFIPTKDDAACYTKGRFTNSTGSTHAEIIAINYQNILISYSTTSIEAYKSIKLELKNLGYKFIEAFDQGNGVIEKSYKKGVKELRLWQNAGTKIDVVYYNIQIYP